MQIACKRFGCQKAVEVCYWTCKHRKNCKDWAGALDGQPGLVAITERLETAATKTGRVFEAKTLVKPVRMKRAATVSALLAPAVSTRGEKSAAAKVPRVKARPQTAPLVMAHAVAKAVPQVVAKTVRLEPQAVPEAIVEPASNGTSPKQRTVKVAVRTVKPERKIMPKPDDEKMELTTEATQTKAITNKPATPAPKAAKPKPPTNGPVYLLLSKNGKYKELREADLMKEAAHIFKDPSLRLVKGQYLVPQITFKAPDE
ncbi:MAG TPA: hypothetical protein VFZ34_26645 [Blastocatellia bacterium]|nr:hypothetical protein [Blastocatellia bacterium]